MSFEASITFPFLYVSGRKGSLEAVMGALEANDLPSGYFRGRPLYPEPGPEGRENQFIPED